MRKMQGPSRIVVMQRSFSRGDGRSEVVGRPSLWCAAGLSSGWARGLAPNWAQLGPIGRNMIGKVRLSVIPPESHSQQGVWLRVIAAGRTREEAGTVSGGHPTYTAFRCGR